MQIFFQYGFIVVDFLFNIKVHLFYTSCTSLNSNLVCEFPVSYQTINDKIS